MTEGAKGLVLSPVQDTDQELNNRRISDAVSILYRRVTTHTTTPTVDDDEQDGYEVGAIWIDTSGTDIYMCIDNSLGAAVWVGLTTELAVLA